MGDISGSSSYDAARANWGGSWRMPTKAEFEELLNNCNWEWTSQGEVSGYKVTSKKNGTSIFFPAAGVCYGTSLSFDGIGGYYWSSTPYGGDVFNAYYLDFGLGNRNTNCFSRYNGRSVRPVSD